MRQINYFFGSVMVVVLLIPVVASGQQDEERLQNKIFGDWEIDIEETRKLMAESGKFTEEQLSEDAFRKMKETRVRLGKDGSMMSTNPGMDETVKRAGKWSNPRVDINARSVMLTVTPDDSDESRDITIAILEVDGDTKLKIGTSRGAAIIFKSAVWPDDDSSEDQ